ncbi:hypothetical protein CYMTET_44072 [Cymbomonas tetramitiformis]|uniref:Myosin n=1 Tax=Cymbomonas tetramitiformis TaxID=36881 RepID=A0AAE0C246_9CHLO|nr:hypothetical protein CYMTET_44072 [Cymbomonas tetramitiformis]
MSESDQKDFNVYVQDDIVGWVRASTPGGSSRGSLATQGSGPVTITTANGNEKACKYDELLPVSQKSLQGLRDMTQLEVLNEGAIQENLNTRYHKDLIYTSVGPLLIAVNPFKSLPLYTPEVMAKYATKAMRMLEEPHIFGTAQYALDRLNDTDTDQAVLISGESGAGKTEGTKICLNYITQISGEGSGEGKRVAEKIMASNPILEAFGNAKTTRNNNSSRFGKFFEIKFDEHDKVLGGCILKYLLEKSRVVHHHTSERTYHIFYQLINGATAEEKERYGIKTQSDYYYLGNRECTDPDEEITGEEFLNVRKALGGIDVTEDMQQQIMKILSCILTIGNITFAVETADSCKIVNEDVVQKVATLLDVDMTVLCKALTERTMKGRGSIYKISLKKDQAEDARDTLAKELYGSLFDWLVNQINAQIDTTKGKRTMGLLDIFGFEVFDENSFEQLCINYANEKLHQQFIEYFFKLELGEYKEEGIDSKDITFKDNTECLELLEGKMGVLDLLAEECRIAAGSDGNWLTKLAQGRGQHPNFNQGKFDRDAVFRIQHFAGEVPYAVRGFLEKNRDTLYQDLQLLLAMTKNNFLLDVLKAGGRCDLEPASPKAGKSTGRNSSGPGTGSGLSKMVGAQFKQQMQTLMLKLSKMQRHYIRCIKPNSKKVADDFDGRMVLEQLRYSGVLESINIRQAGYGGRCSYTDACMIAIGDSALDMTHEDQYQYLQRIMEELKLPTAEYAFGKTKVFFKQPDGVQNFAQSLGAMVVRIQAVMRGKWQRMGYLHNLKYYMLIMRWMKRSIAMRRKARMLTDIKTVQKLARRHLAKKKFKKLKKSKADATLVRAVHTISMAFLRHKALKKRLREEQEAAAEAERLAKLSEEELEMFKRKAKSSYLEVVEWVKNHIKKHGSIVNKDVEVMLAEAKRLWEKALKAEEDALAKALAADNSAKEAKELRKRAGRGGMVQKQGITNYGLFTHQKWQARWFRIKEDGKLSYYKSQAHEGIKSKVKGEINIPEAFEVNLMETKEKQYVITVVYNKAKAGEKVKDLVFALSTDVERQEWVETLDLYLPSENDTRRSKTIKHSDIFKDVNQEQKVNKEVTEFLRSKLGADI